MSKTVRVSNLALNTTAIRLGEICGEFGRVARVRMAESPLSGTSRGFGFVEMTSDAEALSCIAGLNQQERDGKKLAVNDAPAKEVKKYVGRK